MKPTLSLLFLVLLAFSPAAYANPSSTIDEADEVMTERPDDAGATPIASDFGDIFVASFDAFDIACVCHTLELESYIAGPAFGYDDTHGLALKPRERTEGYDTLA